MINVREILTAIISIGKKEKKNNYPYSKSLEPYTSGTGQKMMVHNKGVCFGPNCVIHNPSNHIMKDFPTYWRSDRSLMERICIHSVGHPDPDGIRSKSDGIHGCDGCCFGNGPP